MTALPDPLSGWLNTRAASCLCPLCRQNAWDRAPGGEHWLPRARGPWALNVIPVVCRECGYVLLLSAAVAGGAGTA